MASRPLRGLAQLLVALLLLAGAPAAAAAHAPTSWLSRLQDRPVQTLLPEDRGLLDGMAGIAAGTDIDDDPEPLALAPLLADVAPARFAVAIAGFVGSCAVPPTHWPCASLSTGPPRR